MALMGNKDWDNLTILMIVVTIIVLIGLAPFILIIVQILIVVTLLGYGGWFIYKKLFIKHKSKDGKSDD
jgi:hypothetical protein